MALLILTSTIFSDWISVNVLRSVALSTNSVAASVEPVMQQNFLSLSPMAGQESFGHTSQMMAHTPTTSSMLAALQNDPFPGGAGSLDPTSSAFNAADFTSLTYMDTSPTSGSQENGTGGLAFPDFSGSGPFDVSGFNPQELNLHPSPAAGTPGSESEHHQQSHSAHPSPAPSHDSGVKSEGEAA
jgi:regulatory factor X, other